MCHSVGIFEISICVFNGIPRPMTETATVLECAVAITHVALADSKNPVAFANSHILMVAIAER